MAPSVTEILFRLGLGSKVVGVTDYCNYPKEASLKPKIGGFLNPSIEKIISLNPDLIIATPDNYNEEIVERLESLGKAVYVINPSSISGILRSILSIGRITGNIKEGILLVSELKKEIKYIRKKVKPYKEIKTLYIINANPLIAVGKNTFVDELIDIAGGENIVNESGYPRLNIEEIILKNPEIILLSHMGGSNRIKSLEKFKIYSINDDFILRPGPRFIKGLRILVKTLHPEVKW
jgi:iron complex transport system substrate-binding protein